MHIQPLLFIICMMEPLYCHLNHVQHLKYIRTAKHTLLRYKRTPLTTLHPFILFMKAALTPILQKP